MPTSHQPAPRPGSRAAPHRLSAHPLRTRARAILIGCCLALELIVLAAEPARAQTLDEALTAAFAGNPGLAALRA